MVVVIRHGLFRPARLEQEDEEEYCSTLLTQAFNMISNLILASLMFDDEIAESFTCALFFYYQKKNKAIE